MEESSVGIRSPRIDEIYNTPATSLDGGPPAETCIKVISLKEEKLPPVPLPSTPLPLIPPIQQKCLIFMVLFWGSITILLIIGLALTVKYLFVDEKSHQHEDTCEIVSCSSTGIIFTLTLNVYTYRQFTLFPDSCPDQNVTTCFYDDRDLPASLSLSALSAPKLGSMLIVGLSMALLMIILITWKYYRRYWNMICSSSAL